MKKEQKQEWDANTLCIPFISLHDPPYSHIQCIQGGVDYYRECTECYHPILVSVLFSPVTIKIFAKCFYLLVNHFKLKFS